MICLWQHRSKNAYLNTEMEFDVVLRYLDEISFNQDDLLVIEADYEMIHKILKNHFHFHFFFSNE